MTTADKPNNNLRGRLLIIGVALMTFGPFTLAWFMAKHPEWLGKTSNYGELVIPPRPIDLTGLSIAAGVPSGQLNELEHRWIILQLTPGDSCDNGCRENLQRSRQLWPLLSKDMPRVRRLLVVNGEQPVADNLQAARGGDETLLIAKASPRLKQQLASLSANGNASQAIWLIDPQGFVMMHYPLDYDAKGMLRDLQRLLKISTSG